MATETAALVVMLIFSPSHLWESAPKATIPGWVSIQACQAAAPILAEKFGATNEKQTGLLGTTVTKERVLARVECLAFENH